jgi:hypothetical protein
VEVGFWVFGFLDQKRAPGPLFQAPSAPAPRTRAGQAGSYGLRQFPKKIKKDVSMNLHCTVHAVDWRAGQGL